MIARCDHYFKCSVGWFCDEVNTPGFPSKSIKASYSYPTALQKNLQVSSQISSKLLVLLILIEALIHPPINPSFPVPPINFWQVPLKGHSCDELNTSIPPFKYK